MIDKPSPKVVLAYLLARDKQERCVHAEALADALQQSEAARLKAQWLLKHQTTWVGFYEDRETCGTCGYDLAQHHNWTDADWLAHADRRLRGEQ